MAATRGGTDHRVTPWTREDLSRSPSRLLSAGRNRTKADVRLVEIDRVGIVVKDFRERSFVVRHTIGRFSLSREARAYARLEALSGIPAFYGRIDAHALAFGYLAGSSLPEHRRRSVPAAFFGALAQLLDQVHERGVAIVDLHHRNVLVEAGTGRPALIDFSLALVRPRPWNLLGLWVFERARRLDRIALDRIRLRYEARPAGSAEPPPSTPPRVYRWGRAVKSWLRPQRKRP